MRVVAAVVACVVGGVVALASPVGAEPLERENYSFQESDTFTDTECGASITIEYAAEFSGVFMLKAGRAGDVTPYFFDNYRVVETYTNTATGATGTIVHQGLFKDLHIEHVEGTVYQFTAIETGRPVVAIGPDGTTLVFDRGRIRYTALIDTLGDADLDNDVFLGDVGEPDLAGPHPIFNGAVDFCDFLDLLR